MPLFSRIYSQINKKKRFSENGLCLSVSHREEQRGKTVKGNDCSCQTKRSYAFWFVITAITLTHSSKWYVCVCLSVQYMCA